MPQQEHGHVFVLRSDSLYVGLQVIHPVHIVMHDAAVAITAPMALLVHGVDSKIVGYKGSSSGLIPSTVLSVTMRDHDYGLGLPGRQPPLLKLLRLAFVLHYGIAMADRHGAKLRCNERPEADVV